LPEGIRNPLSWGIKRNPPADYWRAKLKDEKE